MSDAETINESTVNGQVTDAVTQIAGDTVGQSAAHSMGLLDTVLSETLGMALHNAVTTQHQTQMAGNAAVTTACAAILQSFVPPSRETPQPASSKGKEEPGKAVTSTSDPNKSKAS